MAINLTSEKINLEQSDGQTVENSKVGSIVDKESKSGLANDMDMGPEKIAQERHPIPPNISLEGEMDQPLQIRHAIPVERPDDSKVNRLPFILQAFPDGTFVAIPYTEIKVITEPQSGSKGNLKSPTDMEAETGGGQSTNPINTLDAVVPQSFDTVNIDEFFGTTNDNDPPAKKRRLTKSD